MEAFSLNQGFYMKHSECVECTLVFIELEHPSIAAKHMIFEQTAAL